MRRVKIISFFSVSVARALSTVLIPLVFIFPYGACGESIDALDGILRGPKKSISTTQLPDSKKHWYSDYHIMAGLKSQNSFGRMSSFGQSFRSREEIYFGMKHQSGWGFNIVAGGSIKSGSTGGNGSSESRASLRGKAKQKAEPGEGVPVSSTNANGYGSFEDRAGVQDPSLAVLHPVYDDGTTSVTGMFRESFPVSERSVANHSWVQGYYSVLSVKMKNRVYFSNTLMAHYFSRASYAPPFDSLTSFGLMTSLNHRVRDWCKIGFGQRTQLDNKMNGPAGTSTELFTLADFNLNQNISAGPRIHFPIAAQNSVFSDGPTTPSTANIQAELYFQVAL